MTKQGVDEVPKDSIPEKPVGRTIAIAEAVRLNEITVPKCPRNIKGKCDMLVRTSDIKFSTAVITISGR